MILWAKHNAWLCAPREDAKGRDLGSRIRGMLDSEEGVEHPEVELQHMIHFLREIDYCRFDSMGLCGWSWSEIQSYSETTSARLTPWETLTLLKASAAYASQWVAAKDPSCPPPWGEHRLTKQEANAKVSEVMEAFFKNHNESVKRGSNARSGSSGISSRHVRPSQR